MLDLLALMRCGCVSVAGARRAPPETTLSEPQGVYSRTAWRAAGREVVAPHMAGWVYSRYHVSEWLEISNFEESMVSGPRARERVSEWMV
jgi:hypothetical protein